MTLQKKELTERDRERCCRCDRTRFEHEHGLAILDHDFQPFDWQAFHRGHLAYLDWQAGTREPRP